MASTTATKHVHVTEGRVNSKRNGAPGMMLLGSTTTTKKLSASCQQVVEEEFADASARVVIRSCLADSQLYPIISGHLCNKNAICPSALNADMATVVAEYIWRSLRPKSEVPGINVCNLEVPRSLVAEIPQRSPGQHLEMEANAELDGDSGTIRCFWRSVHPDGTKIQSHAHCIVRYEDREDWTLDWSKVSHMVRNSMKLLREKAKKGKADVMETGLAYKAFASFVDYSKKYQAMDQVVFDGLEGCSSLTFKTDVGDYTGPFHLGTYAMLANCIGREADHLQDNTCHLSGFLCNASDMDDNVYISEGWDTWRCLKPELIDEAHNHRLENYVLMQSRGKGVLQGDVYVLRDGEVVAVWGGIRFKKVSRKVINMLLPQPKA